MQNTEKENYPGSIGTYDAQPGNKMGLYYQSSWADKEQKKAGMWRTEYKRK